VNRLEPIAPDAVSQPFWDATREDRLLVQWCTDCEHPIFFPREVCPRCLGSALEWRPSAGTGRVYAASVQHRPAWPSLKDDVPYVVALVDLDDGIRMMTNVVDCEPDAVVPDLEVEVCWEPLSDGRKLPLFRPRT
jgi:uncharacterized OB-fold protein